MADVMDLTADLDTDLDQGIGRYARQLAELVRHPGYRALIEELERTPDDQRVGAAQRLARREELVRRGVRLPEDFRITLRSFEEPGSRWSRRDITSESSVLAPRAGWTICGSVGYVLCASIGRQLQ